VEQYFPPEAKAQIEDLVHHLMEAFCCAHRPAAVDDAGKRDRRPRPSLPPSKSRSAILTTGAIIRPWTSAAATPWVTSKRAELFEYHRNLAKLSNPVDRSEWVMVPQEVNAVNLPAMNALNFPAAILQPPYFDPKRPAAINYGAIGATIGHEDQSQLR